jgi:peptidoglycan hydrolase-like protein with peptidoglycan-binding domain
VQQALQKKGIDAGPIDGVFGPKTLSAVRKFQQQQGLATTGRIDQQTLAALSVEASAFGTGAEPRGNAPGSGSDRPDMEPAGTGSGSARTRQ